MPELYTKAYPEMKANSIAQVICIPALPKLYIYIHSLNHFNTRQIKVLGAS